LSQRVLFAAAEAAPLSKTGGLADVAHAVPRAACAGPRFARRHPGLPRHPRAPRRRTPPPRDHAARRVLHDLGRLCRGQRAPDLAGGLPRAVPARGRALYRCAGPGIPGQRLALWPLRRAGRATGGRPLGDHLAAGGRAPERLAHRPRGRVADACGRPAGNRVHDPQPRLPGQFSRAPTSSGSGCLRSCGTTRPWSSMASSPS
jgi:hypothetical protein